MKISCKNSDHHPSSFGYDLCNQSPTDGLCLLKQPEILLFGYHRGALVSPPFQLRESATCNRAGQSANMKIKTCSKIHKDCGNNVES